MTREPRAVPECWCVICRSLRVAGSEPGLHSAEPQSLLCASCRAHVDGSWFMRFRRHAAATQRGQDTKTERLHGLRNTDLVDRRDSDTFYTKEKGGDTLRALKEGQRSGCIRIQINGGGGACMLGGDVRDIRQQSLAAIELCASPGLFERPSNRRSRLLGRA